MCGCGRHSDEHDLLKHNFTLADRTVPPHVLALLLVACILCRVICKVHSVARTAQACINAYSMGYP